MWLSRKENLMKTEMKLIISKDKSKLQSIIYYDLLLKYYCYYWYKSVVETNWFYSNLTVCLWFKHMFKFIWQKEPRKYIFHQELMIKLFKSTFDTMNKFLTSISSENFSNTYPPLSYLKIIQLKYFTMRVKSYERLARKKLHGDWKKYTDYQILMKYW